MLQTVTHDTGSRSATNVINGINNRVQKMESTLKIWHAFLATAAFLITIISTIVVFSNKVETQRLRIEYLESADRDKSLQIKDLNQKQQTQYEQINAKLTDILIMLQNKENKK